MQCLKWATTMTLRVMRMPLKLFSLSGKFRLFFLFKMLVDTTVLKYFKHFHVLVLYFFKVLFWKTFWRCDLNVFTRLLYQMNTLSSDASECTSSNGQRCNCTVKQWLLYTYNESTTEKKLYIKRFFKLKKALPSQNSLIEIPDANSKASHALPFACLLDHFSCWKFNLVVSSINDILFIVCRIPTLKPGCIVMSI